MIFTILFALFNAYYDFTLIRAGKSIKHGLEAAIRFVIIFAIWILSSANASRESGGFLLRDFFPAILTTNLKEFLLLLTVFWIVFEVTLNLLRNKNILYVGYTAFLDKLIRKLPYPEYSLLLIKLTLLIITR